MCLSPKLYRLVCESPGFMPLVMPGRMKQRIPRGHPRPPVGGLSEAIAGEANTGAGLAALPGARGIQLVLEGCHKRLGDVTEVDRLRESIVKLEQAVERHAGDRASLGLLSAVWEPKAVEGRTEALRRYGFRAQCALLGIQAKTQFRGIIYAPSRSGDPDTVSMATYQCFDGLVRLRDDRPCRLLFIEAPTHDDGSASMPPEHMTQHMLEKFQFDEDFSSGDGDEIKILVQGNRGWVTLKPGNIGKAGAAHWAFTGSAAYEHPRFASPKDRFNQVGINTLVPTERMHLDCLMDRSLAEHMELRQSVTAACFDASTGLPMRPTASSDPAFLFDLQSPKALGAVEIASDPLSPDLTPLIDRAAKRVGSSLENLVGVRFTSSYVMSPSTFVLTRDLPTNTESHSGPKTRKE